MMLAGIGLYTPSEAGRLIDVSPQTLSRWLRGHTMLGRTYAPLWDPEIDLGDGATYLSFRDLLEARAAALFINKGLSPQKVRAAIALAREVVGERPLSTTWLRTDGRSMFLRLLQAENDEPQLLDLLRKQFAFNSIVEPSLRDVDFDGVTPRAWWPRGRKMGVLVDPNRAFGQPIEKTTSVPAMVLADAAAASGTAASAARAWDVQIRAVQRSIRFQQALGWSQVASLSNAS